MYYYLQAQKMLILMVAICSIILGCDGQSHWSYQTKGKLGPRYWCPLFETCCGNLQSPIHINTQDVKYTNHKLHISNLDLLCEKMTIYNNGHTVQLTVNSTSHIPRLTLRRKTNEYDLPNLINYTFNHLHFHFGSDDTFGSEHKIDAQSFPMEQHVVFINPRYSTFDEARTQKGGVAVVAVLFNTGELMNTNLEPMIEALQSIAYQETSYSLVPFPLKYFFPKDIDHHYLYEGSVTTPPCEETVTWFILKNKLPISQIQMMRFRQLTKNGPSAKTGLNGPQHHGDGSSFIHPNIRPLQKLNDRTVYDNKPKHKLRTPKI